MKKYYTNLFGNRWLLVVHGASEDHLTVLSQYFDSDEITCAAVAYETGKQGIHPHWQIYFQTAQQCRMKQKIGELLATDQFHLELARGTPRANLRYVYAVDKDHEIGWVRYAKNAPTPRGYCPRKRDNLLWLHSHMKPWQTQIHNKVVNTPSFRDILWVWQPVGNTGKTYLAKYLHYFHGAIITGGKSADMKHAIARWRQITGHYPVIIIFDLARSDRLSEDSYRTIEQIKNAIFFSGKYESGMVAAVNPPHIVLFANHPPDRSMMSLDRWDVRTIDPQTDTLISTDISTD